MDVRATLLSPLAAILLLCAIAPGCKKDIALTVTRAGEHADSLADLVDKDVEEIRHGLPDGAKKLEPLYAKGANPKDDLSNVRATLNKAQREVPDLNIAKSTFFALADEKGIGIRNNLEQDAMASQDLAGLFPELKKALTTGAYTETVGTFGGPPGPNGPDKDWVAAIGVKNEAGAVAGLYVTGWSFRRFSLHLQEVLKRQLQEELKKSGDVGKLPVFYVGIFDGSGVYTAPLTPKINEQAMIDAKLVEKTANGPYKSSVNITDRDFGYAAKRTPKLGTDVGVVVLRSEL